MRQKRTKGRSQLISDPFGHVREQKRKRTEASYLARAQAMAEAEENMAAAEAALAAAGDAGDESDDEVAAPARKKARQRPGSRA